MEPTDLTGSIKDRDNIYNHLETMIKSAKKTVTLATTSDGLVRKTEALKSTLAKAKQRGVTIKIAAPLTKDAKKAADQLSKFAEIKNTEVRTRVCVVDGKEILFMLADDQKIHPSYDVGVWVNTEFFWQCSREKSLGNENIYI